MALTDDGSNGGMIMPVTPMYGGGYGNNGFFGGDWSAWLILLLLFGMGGFGGWGMGGFGGGMFEFPWLLNGQNGINNNTNSRFDTLGLSSQLTGIQNSLNSAEVANCNRAMDSMQTAYNNQIASMNQNFANQQALDQRLYAMQSQQADCCCENRLATANLSALVQSENCADREALSNGIRDIISNQTAGVQRILDTMCQDKIDSKNEKIQELQTQVALQNLAASQAAQTAQLVADNTAQTQYIVNRVAPYPIPSYSVPNPFGCNGYNGGYGFNG